jgi:catalase
VGIAQKLPSGAKDPGILVDPKGFVDAIARHRHPQRDSDPPLI